MDYWGTLESGGVALVEWGDKFDEAMPEGYLNVRMSIVDDEVRRIDLVPAGERGATLADHWLGEAVDIEGVEVFGRDAR